MPIYFKNYFDSYWIEKDEIFINNINLYNNTHVKYR